MSPSAPRPPFYLGIDLGGSSIKSGVVDDAGVPFPSAEPVPTHAEKGPEVGLDNLVKAANEAVARSGLSWDRIAAVGLGSPGTMDIGAGLLLDPPNLPGWTNLPIRDLLAKRLQKPTVLQNDANAAAFGEYWVGAGRNTRCLVLFTLGTGIGGGIIEEGEIIEGRHSHGAECGHIIIEMDGGRECSCGKHGHLEAYASATALVKRAHEALEEEISTELADLLARGDLTSKSISEASARGDSLAKRLMHETARYLAVGAVSLMHTVDPDVVLFAGGMTAAGEPFLADIQKYVRSLAFPIPAARTQIRFAKLGNDAGFIGAAGCARKTFGNPAH
jgi:glucokinase